MKRNARRHWLCLGDSNGQDGLFSSKTSRMFFVDAARELPAGMWEPVLRPRCPVWDKLTVHDSHAAPFRRSTSSAVCPARPPANT